MPQQMIDADYYTSIEKPNKYMVNVATWEVIILFISLKFFSCKQLVCIVVLRWLD